MNVLQQNSSGNAGTNIGLAAGAAILKIQSRSEYLIKSVFFQNIDILVSGIQMLRTSGFQDIKILV